VHVLRICGNSDFPSGREIVSTESYLLSSAVGRRPDLDLPTARCARLRPDLLHPASLIFQDRRSNGAAWYVSCNERQGATLMTDRRSAARLWAALLIVYLVWGSTYLAIRVVVQGGLPPLLSMGIRFLLAAPLLAAFVALRGGLGRLRITRRELLASAAVGTLLVAMGNGMVAVAEQTVPSGLAALLIASVPLLMVVLRLTRRDMPRLLVWLGVIIGFIGVAFLGLQGGGMADVERWGVPLTLFAATCWGIGSFYSRSWGVPTDSLVATVYEMALGGIVAVAIGLARGERLPLQVGVLPASTWVAFGYLVVVGSMVAYTAYAWLLQNAPISLTSTYAYVNPAVAVLLGAVILSEPVTGVVLIGGGLAILGVALVVTAEPPRTAAPKPAVTPAPSPAAAADRA
jgi:drug/metabolite transporter (DMT)-like permease